MDENYRGSNYLSTEGSIPLSGIGRGACGYHPAKIPGHHAVGTNPTHSLGGAFAEGINPTGPPQAMPTTQSQIAKGARILHGVEPIPAGFDVGRTGFL